MPILGNPILIGGGGGGELLPTDAILRVQAPANSTVTITKGTVTKTDLGHENANDHTVYDYYFIIHQSQFDSVNPWTVTATLSGKTATDTIIINAADEYDIVINYTLWLYNQGDIYEAITGGWSKITSSSTFTLGTTEMSLLAKTNGTERFAATENAIDLTAYNTLYFSAKCDSGYSGKNVGIATTRGGSYVSSVALVKSSSYSIVSIDISNITGAYYVQFSNASTGDCTYVNQIYAV